MDDYTVTPGSKEFKRSALHLCVEILTETTISTRSGQIYGGMHAPTSTCCKVFRKHEEMERYVEYNRFRHFCKGDELPAYFDTLRRLLVRSSAERPEFIVQGQRNETQGLIQEWYDDNQEIIEEKRDAIHELVLVSFKVIWDMRRGLDEDGIVDEFQSDRRIVEAKDDDELLVDAVLQPAQICNMYAVVASKKGALYGLDNLFKDRLLGEQDSAYRWDIVRGKYRTAMPAVSRSNRQHLAAIENQRQEREERLDGVVEHIETSADIDTICNEELRPHIKNSRVCEAAFSRISYLFDDVKYISDQDLVDANAAELIPVVMSLHEENHVVQDCGMRLLVCQKSTLAKSLSAYTPDLEKVICTAMINYPNELEFHRRGLELLFVLQDCAEESHLLVEWYSKMVDGNALDALTATLIDHSKHFSIVRHALTLLGNILGGSGEVSDRENLLAHDDLHSLVNNRHDLCTIVKRAYNIQKEDKKKKAKTKLRPLKNRVISLVNRLRET